MGASSFVGVNISIFNITKESYSIKFDLFEENLGSEERIPFD